MLSEARIHWFDTILGHPLSAFGRYTAATQLGR